MRKQAKENKLVKIVLIFYFTEEKSFIRLIRIAFGPEKFFCA